MSSCSHFVTPMAPSRRVGQGSHSAVVVTVELDSARLIAEKLITVELVIEARERREMVYMNSVGLFRVWWIQWRASASDMGWP
jgi:hypothetical protein